MTSLIRSKLITASGRFESRFYFLREMHVTVEIALQPQAMHEEQPGPQRNCVFATTHWSVVLTAREASSPEGAAALEKLCRAYWYPLYAYVRRRGFSEHDAQDLTQGFFAQLLDRQSLQRVTKDKGRFRSFLLASINYFIADQRDSATAQKRGGGQQVLSFDAQEAETRYRMEPVDERTPEAIFEHHWAITLLDQVLVRLREEFAQAGKGHLFEALQPFLVEGAEEKTYAEAAPEIGLSEEAFKKAVQRMRHRYHKLFREEIAHTVAGSDEVEEELRNLCTVLGG
jgi:RNA polymerase sigma-70 factor (ECF subfamily)